MSAIDDDDEILPWEEEEKDSPQKGGKELVRPVILTPPEPRILRDELQAMVARDLLGPAGGVEEELDEANVRDRYILGVLAPRHRMEKDEEAADDDLGQAGGTNTEDGSPDTGAPQRGTMFPSSVGMTFHVDGKAERLRIVTSWGRYERVDSQYLQTDRGNPKKVWRRVPVTGTYTLPLAAGRFTPWAPDPESPEVKVQGVVRRKTGEDNWTVTLFLVNGQREQKPNRDRWWLFQASLAAQGMTEADAPFVWRRPLRRQGRLDEEFFQELRSLEMLYRRRAEFAIGHGTAVHAEPVAANPLRAYSVETRSLPRHEVAAIEPVSLPALVLDMKELAQTPDSEFATRLGPLSSAYAEWIAAQRQRLEQAADGLEDFLPTAKEALSRCEIAQKRIQEGIDLLASDPQAAESFRFANQAMWLQRVHSLYAERKRRGEDVQLKDLDEPKNRTWRPFQLAFILLNLPGITQLDHPERADTPAAIADLLWFPTGGGKTEAYLGLTAYTIGLRRLQGVIEGRSGEYGIAVLMRYTLRLLTMQQFQRAAALICACESIRRKAETSGNAKWGKLPFRIGLWVGNRTTPNTTDQSDQAVRDIRDRKFSGGTGDPAQLTFCPWCGETISPGSHIIVDTVRGRTLLFCGDATGKCAFSRHQSPNEGLPVLVVDEEIYRQLPSLLIATVDKFAQMPWNGVTQTLFGQVDGYCERHGFRSPDLLDSDSHPRQGSHPSARTLPQGPVRPPDLIIQDELHLISGPLGSLVGLYETAVDFLSSWQVNGKTVRPKLIASTATVRNARMQVHKTFRRQVCIFPPQGLDAEDNFFARQSSLDDRAGRLYVGICAPGRRLKSVLIRVYIAYLAAAQSLHDKYGLAADPWMTLVGYFNSMRELGGMRRLVDDDIRSGLAHADKRGFPKRTVRSLEELTSRVHSSTIPLLLDRMEVQHTGKREDRLPIDLLLATNMISVGVDIKRLGLMVVANQPKTTSEYIQATSRVGRTFPGLVCTVLNWTRPRDLSHFERFEHYHSTFYQHVEALSVTPFAPRALDRGLTALLIACTRLSDKEFNANEKAGSIKTLHPLIARAKKAIAARAWEVEGVEARDRVLNDLASRVDAWAARAQNLTGGAVLGYRGRNDGRTFGLLESPGTDPWQEFTCLNSLRDVEPMVNLILNNAGMEDATPVLSQSAPSVGDADQSNAEDLLL